MDREKSNIVLIGFIASGKTSLARELARVLNRRQLDSDELIEARERRPVREIYEVYGEKVFRELEKEIIAEVSQLEDYIISTGGGVCLDPENIEALRENGRLILLEADIDSLRERIDPTRPILKSGEDLEEMMKARRDSYHRAADLRVDTSHRSIEDIRDEILTRLKLEKLEGDEGEFNLGR